MIRRIQDTDFDQVVDLLILTYGQEPWNESWSLEFARSKVTELMSGPMSIGYVLEKDNQIIGAMCGRRSTYVCGYEYFIDEFFIHPKYQGEGLGSKMLKHAKRELKKEKFVSITLNTGKGLPSEKFYKKNGFQQKDSLIFMYCNVD